MSFVEEVQPSYVVGGESTAVPFQQMEPATEGDIWAMKRTREEGRIDVRPGEKARSKPPSTSIKEFDLLTQLAHTKSNLSLLEAITLEPYRS